jgi:uncharacterized protein
MFEGDGLEILDLEESLRLLSSSPVGRIVFTDQTLPVVVPVNFAVDGEAIVIHTASQSSLGATLHGSVLAFQADDIDPVRQNGWTVSAVGQAELVTDPVEATRLSALLPHLDGSSGDTHVVVLRLGVVRGLRTTVERTRPERTTGASVRPD